MYDSQAMPQSQNGVMSASVKPSASVSPDQVPDPEVVPRAKRRRLSKPYKLRILQQADECTKPGQIGALLRSEGLYSSHLTRWRHLRDQGMLGQKQSGRPEIDASQKELARLRAENARLSKKLEQAETIIDVQKKLSVLLGLSSDKAEKGGKK